MKTIVWTLKADADLAAMSKDNAALVEAKVEQYAFDPSSLAANIKMLKGGEGRIRLRVKSYRVLIKDNTVINILGVPKRDKVYRK